MSSIIEPTKQWQTIACLRKLKEIGFNSEADWQTGISLLRWAPVGRNHLNAKQLWRAWYIINRHKDKLIAAGLEVPPDPGIVSTHNRTETKFYRGQ